MGAFIGGLLATIPLSILRGWVLSVLWNWFVTTLGAPRLSVVAAIGLGTIVTMMTIVPRQEDAERGVLESCFLSVFISLFALGVGWVTHLFLVA